MSIDEQNSSWHPALMPNNAVDSLPADPDPHPDPHPQTNTEPLSTDPIQDGSPQTFDASTEAQSQGEALDTNTGNSNAWFTDEPTDDWPVLDDSNSVPAASTLPGAEQPSEESAAPIKPSDAIGAPKPEGQVQTQSRTDATAEDQSQPEAQPEVSAAGPALGHSSTVSFARTVSHEVSFNDEDDPEWNLSRTDTDPFKFMPPSDRTNSFPAVPPMDSTDTPLDDQPLPSSQAHDMIRELETDGRQSGDTAPEFNASSTADEQPGSHDAPTINGPQYFGRGTTDTNEDELGSRFEEGIPLIPREATDEKHQDNAQAATDAGVLFGDETEGDDDFFSQMQTSSTKQAHPDADDGFTLQRKSTMQVINALGASPMPTADTLDDMPEAAEEEEEEEEERHKNDRSTDAQMSTGGRGLGITMSAQEQSAADQAPTNQTGNGDDLAAKWQAALAADDDDDDFLIDETPVDSEAINPTAFLGSDDEGLLEDDDDQPSSTVQPSLQPAPATASVATAPLNHFPARYTPAAPSPNAVSQSTYVPSPQPSPMTMFSPSTPASGFTPTTSPYAMQPPHPPAQAAYRAPQARPEAPKAQSFVDKSKGGYTSPYDLPMEVVKPRKRASMQHLPRSIQTSSPPGPTSLPPRSSSMQTQMSPVPGPPPVVGHAGETPPVAQKPTAPPPKQKENFFEDLPVTSRPRPSSRQSNRLPSPSQISGPPGPISISTSLPSSASEPNFAIDSPKHDAPSISRPSSTGLPNLVAPPRVSPYASLPSAPQPSPGMQSNSRYSPAPAQGPLANGTARPGSSSRYSPAPTGSRPPSASYSSAPAPAVLPHQPRTSSPLAHFEISHERAQSAPLPNGEHSPQDRRFGSHHEPRLQRVPSLPPTHEVEEEEDLKDPQPPPPSGGRYTPVTASTESKYASASPLAGRHTPPPSLRPSSSHAMLSPPKRASSNYAPQPTGLSPDQGFAPPRRSQTQSPSAMLGNRTEAQASETVVRPSSMHGPATSSQPSPSAHGAYAAVASRSRGRPRGTSQSFSMIAPTDGRENDPLQRWKGAPLFSWGVGGTLVTSFPKDVPRYGMGQAAPMIVRTPGEVRIQSIKDVQPLEETLAKFPGPLKGKSKKKETIAWLTAGIEALEKSLPDHSFQTQTHLSHEDKRAAERVLLWKILAIFIEYDGALEGNPQVEKAVRDVLSLDLPSEPSEAAPLYGSGAVLDTSAATKMQAEAVDSGAVEQIRKHLLAGEREKAAWAAADKRLWGHAMLISNTVSPDLYKKVAQEFIRKEVNYPGHNNESIATLYNIFAGNHEECVDELVPSHARAGLHLVNTTSTTSTAKDALDGLDKWRETLGLVLSNRSADDIRALNALGNLLSTYGRAEAAHVCFLFARKATVFGGLDDPTASFVLLGADHRTQAEQFAKDTEALLLSEVYEYGLSLGSGSMSTGVPHLAAYKLQHAVVLAEHGFRDKALQYCEAIAASTVAQTKRSPYHHALLEAAVDDLTKRLKQAPKEESSSWISKPSMNKVSDSMWNRFNKFVAGDEAEGAAAGAQGENGVETGPFARIAGGTPTISPSPSMSNFDVYATSRPIPIPISTASAPPPVPATRAASRYAPMAGQAAASSGSHESGSPYTPYTPHAPAPRSSMESQPGHGAGNYAPQQYTPQGAGTLPSQAQSATAPATGAEAEQPNGSALAPSPYGPYGSQQPPTAASAGTFVPAEPNGESEPTQGFQPLSSGYEPPSMVPSEVRESQQTEESGTAGGFEPPSYQPYGYEPPSYEPYTEPSNEEGEDGGEAKRKKKSIMDDDDDGIPALRAQAKTKEEKDRENEEMFRKAAEEDAKRAAQQQSAKKGWGFTSWFGGKKEASADLQQANKPIKAKLGEASSFVYDPELKRWVNKKAGADQNQARTETPPPPRSGSRSHANTPSPPPAGGAASAPPMTGRPPRPPMTPAGSNGGKAPSQQERPSSQGSLGPPGGPPPFMARSVSNHSVGGPPSGPPSRPTTSMSNASSIDDLLGPAVPRKAGAKKARKSGRYVDVMAK
ncbi:hypothetical protein SODALDRAFT_326309 [Sodiomyces alkalinus F11]|uniref:Protein transport protein sec16 n=1 Tax=Sodiomyces alkalinus (strain CBS 110278 / VKM F-3762 / F11) TaxID=1314773 RepID=A0A3N2Q5T5_SODAK|nr:hypothetical protein SODALDRAFT_326309 [Sodiomyces alkalinus F11]ROT42144.1 hypothetical protein SODALDRAFT_326309 [Sodiomyces alkalinus F11]